MVCESSFYSNIAFTIKARANKKVSEIILKIMLHSDRLQNLASQVCFKSRC